MKPVLNFIFFLLNHIIKFPQILGHSAGKVISELLLDSYTKIDNAILEPEGSLEEFIDVFEISGFTTLSDLGAKITFFKLFFYLK